MIGKKLQRVRNSESMTLQTLSEESGIPVKVLREYESGDDTPNSLELIILADVFKVRVAYFLRNVDADIVFGECKQGEINV